MFIVSDLKTDKGAQIAVLTAQPKVFKTGSRGFYANGKIEVEGKRYQVQIQIVEIGSKTAAADVSGAE